MQAPAIMPTRIGIRIASLIAALAVAILLGARVDAASTPAGRGDLVPLLAPPTSKPTHKPRATPTAVPTPTPTPTPAPTRQPTPRPTVAATPRATTAPAKATSTPAATKKPAKTATPTRTAKPSSTKAKAGASASARPTSQPLAAGRISSRRGDGDGELTSPSPLAEDDVLIAGILMFAFCSAGAAALYAFGRRQSAGQAQLATLPALVAAPIASLSPRGYETLDEVHDEEAGVPRWLRASLRAERFWTPSQRDPERGLLARSAAEVFTELPADVPKSVVRHDVTLLDGPNESYAAIVGRLHAGDEVLVSLMAEEWAEVRTPRGAGGWVPSMALDLPQAEPARVAPEQPAPKPGNRRRAKRPRKGGPANAG